MISYNNRFIKLGIIPIVGVLTLVNCHSPKTVDLASTIQWKSVSDSITYVAPTLKERYGIDSCYRNEAFLNYSYNLQIPETQDSALQPLIDSLTCGITQIFFNTSNKDFNQGSNKHIQELKEWVNTQAQEAISYECLNLGGLYEKFTDSLCYAKQSLISLRLNMGSIIGGSAHGTETTTVFNYDVKNHKRLTAQLLFQDGSTQAIKDLIIKHLNQVFNTNSNKELEENLLVTLDEIPVNDNFYLTDDNLVFCYNTYEIACYACGTIIVPIPYEEVSQYLNDSYSFLYR